MHEKPAKDRVSCAVVRLRWMALTAQRCSWPECRSRARGERPTRAMRVLLALLQACHRLGAVGILQAQLNNFDKAWAGLRAKLSQFPQAVGWHPEATAPRAVCESGEDLKR